MMRWVGRVLVLLLAAAALAGAPALARSRTHHPRAPRIKGAAHIHASHAPRMGSVRIQRSDGTVLHGLRDQYGTTLYDGTGKSTRCASSPSGAADLNVSCY